MICKLCIRDKALCDSHIIPEFAYKPLYDEKHSFSVLSMMARKQKRTEQKGIREKLLCKECEVKLSRYEDYAKRAIVGGVVLSSVDTAYGKRIEGINYKKFKLFMLSILYRSSVSKHQLFRKVALGPHEEKLRLLLINEQPGTQSDYPCLIVALSGDKNLTRNLIDQPDKLKIGGRVLYRFIFLGFVWIYIVSSHLKKSFLQEFLLTEQGAMTVPSRSFEDLQHIRKFFESAARESLV